MVSGVGKVASLRVCFATLLYLGDFVDEDDYIPAEEHDHGCFGRAAVRVRYCCDCGRYTAVDRRVPPHVVHFGIDGFDWAGGYGAWRDDLRGAWAAHWRSRGAAHHGDPLHGFCSGLCAGMELACADGLSLHRRPWCRRIFRSRPGIYRGACSCKVARQTGWDVSDQYRRRHSSGVLVQLPNYARAPWAFAVAVATWRRCDSFLAVSHHAVRHTAQLALARDEEQDGRSAGCIEDDGIAGL